MSQRKWAPWMALGLVAGFLMASPARAQVTIPQEYNKLIKHSGDVTAFGNEGFGDKIDFGSGGLQIVQTDIDLPGNNALPVRLSRRFVAGDKFGGGFFGAWGLDIPYIHGIFGNHPTMPKGWRVPGVGANQYKRCSLFAAPPDLVFQTYGHYLADEYWHGSFFYLPGGGDQELLTAGPNAHVPTDGNTYPIVTKDGAAVRCVALASTSETGSQGEGFEVVTPDGLIYTMNQMLSRTNEMITKPIDQMGFRKTGGSNRRTATVPGPQPNGAINFILLRNEVRVYPTKVADRFGNYVTYTWSATNPEQLLQISASDGRQITFTYGTNIVVSDGSHSWTYATSGGIDTVTLPDGSAWSYNLSALGLDDTQMSGNGCDSNVVYGGATSMTGSVTAPTGATATFTLAPVTMGRSWVPKECVYVDGEGIYAYEPNAFVTLAVVGKTITGPGLPGGGLSWVYAYGPPNNCWSHECTGASPTTRTMTVTDPDGAVNRYTFGNVYSVSEGLPLKVESGWNGTSALRTVETTYADPNAAPYSVTNGSSPRLRGDVLMNDQHPQRQVTTTQQGRTFTWKVETGCIGMPYCFDTYARPTKVTKASSP